MEARKRRLLTFFLVLTVCAIIGYLPYSRYTTFDISRMAHALLSSGLCTFKHCTVDTISGVDKLPQRDSFIENKTASMDLEEGFKYLNSLVSKGRFIKFETLKRTDIQPESGEIKYPLNITTEPSKERSVLRLVSTGRDASGQYEGDVATVRLDLRDSLDKAITYGGHQVRLWITDQTGRKVAALHCLDLHNGSYLTTVPFLWAGKTRVHASLTLSWNMQQVMIDTMFKLGNPQPLAGVFIRAKTSQATLCGTLPIIQGFLDTCNLTSRNGGVPWFCGKPTKQSLKCSDYKLSRAFVRHNFPRPWQEKGIKKFVVDFNRRLNVTKEKIASKLDLSPTTVSAVRGAAPCWQRGPGFTWTDRSPRGFWTGQQWTHLSCTAAQWTDRRISQCLTNATFWFLGDSNSHRLFSVIAPKVKCRPKAETKTPYRHHQRFRCTSPNIGFSMYWNGHGFPYQTSVLEWYDVNESRAPPFYIDQIPPQGRHVIMINTYAHYIFFPPSVFTAYVKALVRALRDLRQRNPSAMVAIRGPGCFDRSMIGDYYKTALMRIYHQEMQELKDYVYFLDVWGMGFPVSDCSDAHPPGYAQSEIARLFLDHVCH